MPAALAGDSGVHAGDDGRPPGQAPLLVGAEIAEDDAGPRGAHGPLERHVVREGREGLAGDGGGPGARRAGERQVLAGAEGLVPLLLGGIRAAREVRARGVVDEERADPERGGEAHIGAVRRGLRGLAALVQDLRAAALAPARPRRELGEERGGERARARLIPRERRIGEARAPRGALREEAVELAGVRVPERGAPRLRGPVEPPHELRQRAAVALDLGELAGHGQPRGGGDALDDLPVRRRSEVGEDLGGEGVERDAAGPRGAAEGGLEVHVGAPDGDVRRVVVDEHGGLRVLHPPGRGERVDELERVPRLLLAAVLGEAAVRRPVGGRREVAADRRPPRSREGEASEAAGEALRHEHHDPHARVEPVDHRAQLADGEHLPVPEQDGVVHRIPAAREPVVGDVEEEHVPRAEPRPRLLEPRGDASLRRGVELGARDRRALEDDGRLQPALDRGAVEPPEVGLGLRLARDEIGRGIGAVGAEEGDALGRDAALEEQGAELAEVGEVRLEVGRRGAAAVDHQRGEARGVRAARRLGDRRRRGGGRRGSGDAAGEEERRGGPAGAQHRVSLPRRLAAWRATGWTRPSSSWSSARRGSRSAP